MVAAKLRPSKVCSPFLSFAKDKSLNVYRMTRDQNICGARCKYEVNALPFNMGCDDQDVTNEAEIADFGTYMNTSVIPLHMKSSDYEAPRQLPRMTVIEHQEEKETGSSTHESLKIRPHVSDPKHSQEWGDIYKFHALEWHKPLSSRIHVTAIACSFLAASGAALYESSRPGDQRNISSNAYADNMVTHDLVLLAIVRRLDPDVLALTVFTVATRTIYGFNRQHPYQDLAVLGSIVFGAFAGMALYRDLQNTMLKAVPWAILMALLVDTIVNRTVS